MLALRHDVLKPSELQLGDVVCYFMYEELYWRLDSNFLFQLLRRD